MSNRIDASIEIVKPAQAGSCVYPVGQRNYAGMTGENELSPEFGPNVSRLRKERGLTHQAVADLAKLHKSHIGPIEKGQRESVETKTLLALAKALGVTPGDLDPQFGREPDPSALSPYRRAERAFVLLADDPATAREWAKRSQNRLSETFEKHTPAEWLRLLEAEFIRDRSGKTHAMALPVPAEDPLPIQVQIERERAMRAAKKKPRKRK